MTMLSIACLALCVSAAMCAAVPEDCPMFCTMIYAPVCGSDGKTYSSDCMMSSASCRSGGKITLVSRGECKQEAQPIKSERECATFCMALYQPVCASDGQTYSNDCSMNAAGCEAGITLKVVSKGECIDNAPKAEPECFGVCTEEYSPVCGSDGQTYSNLCQMNSESCTSGTQLKVEHDGACKEEVQCQIMCPMIYMPVCASDGQTYGNECSMKSHACENGLTLDVVSAGECPEVSDKCKVVPCTKEYNPVCGSDKKVYGNACMFSNAQCDYLMAGKDLKKMSSVYCVLELA